MSEVGTRLVGRLLEHVILSPNSIDLAFTNQDSRQPPTLESFTFIIGHLKIIECDKVLLLIL